MPWKMKRSRSQHYIITYDKVVVTCYLLLCLAGLLIMLDLTSIQDAMGFFYRHAIFLAVSLVTAIFILYFFNMEKLRGLNGAFIAIVIGLLIAVLIVGRTVKGGTRAINLGFISIQPSFLARVALIFYYAHHLDKKHDELIKALPRDLWAHFYPLIVATGLVYGLIILERHLSTLVISGMTLLGLLTYAGIRKRFILAVSAIGVLAVIGIIMFGAQFRSSRIETFKTYFLLTRTAPSDSSQADDYQVKESITALTRGGWFGTGMSRGRAKHFYLPESRTDYIFTIIGEEFGFIGAFLVLALHCVLFFRAFKIAHSQPNLYLRFLCAGLAMNIFFNALVNTGVAMSILPATGNTLPFISYGGTALLVDSASVGVILNISARRREL